MELGRGPNGEQFTRHRDGLPNWVLTDYLEFRWFVTGEKRLAARIAELWGKRKITPSPGGEEGLAQILNPFFKQPGAHARRRLPTARSPRAFDRVGSRRWIREQSRLFSKFPNAIPLRPGDSFGLSRIC